MARTLTDDDTVELQGRLASHDAALDALYPGDAGARQPVHTVYGGAHLFRPDTTRRLGDLAQASLDAYAPDPHTFADAIGVPEQLAETVYARVRDKLDREPVEDFRIDFEDGYGNRPDEEEDGHAEQAARAVAQGLGEGTLPPFLGIRVKPFTPELRQRAMRTTDIFLSTMLDETGGEVPPGFVVTLPKITIDEQPAVLDDLLGRIERVHGLDRHAVPIELMIELTQTVIDIEGRINVRRLVDAASGRCIAAHFGTYDYTASCDITAAHQHMTHPACDFARHVMQVSLGGSGIWLSDGATNIMPVGPHRAPEGGALTVTQREENVRVVHHAWRLHVEHIRHSLVHAYYQGWDLHPAQLPTRYAALYSFFLEGLDQAAERLRTFVDRAAQATLVGDVFDDAATGQGLLNFFLRAINCGAVDEDEVAERTGLSLDELRGRSFVKILDARTG